MPPYEIKDDQIIYSTSAPDAWTTVYDSQLKNIQITFKNAVNQITQQAENNWQELLDDVTDHMVHHKDMNLNELLNKHRLGNMSLLNPKQKEELNTIFDGWGEIQI